MLRYLPILLVVVFTSGAQAASDQYAEGMSKIRFDKTCNCFQFSEERLHPDPSPATPFTGLPTGETYRGAACIKTDTPDKFKIETSRRNFHTGGTCGSEATKDITPPGSVCFSFNISINSEDIECDYHWIIK